MNPGLDVDEDEAIEVNDVGDGINDGIDDGINDDVNEDGKLEFTCGMRISLGISSSSLLLLDSRVTNWFTIIFTKVILLFSDFAIFSPSICMSSLAFRLP